MGVGGWYGAGQAATAVVQAISTGINYYYAKEMMKVQKRMAMAQYAHQDTMAQKSRDMQIDQIEVQEERIGNAKKMQETGLEKKVELKKGSSVGGHVISRKHEVKVEELAWVGDFIAQMEEEDDQDRL